MRNIHLNAAILVSVVKNIGPSLDKLQHLVSDILVSRALDQLSIHLAIRLVRDLFVNRCSAVFDDRFKHHECVESSVRVWREHFLLDLLNCILWPKKKLMNHRWRHLFVDLRCIVLPDQVAYLHDRSPVRFQLQVGCSGFCNDRQQLNKIFTKTI